MSHSPPSSAASAGPSSSPFTGTDPTLYSPELSRGARGFYRRNNISQVTVVAGSQSFGGVELASDKYKSTLILPAPYVQGAFVNEIAEDAINYISRYQAVAQLPDGTNAGLDTEHELFSVQHQMKLYACFNTSIPVYSRGVYLRYDDLRDAAEGKDILQQHGFTINYVSGYDFALAKSQDTAQLNEFEGQVRLPVVIEPHPEHALWEFASVDLEVLTKNLETAVGIFGPVRNCIHIGTDEANMALIFRLEFHSVDAANRAVQSLQADSVWGVSDQKTFHWRIAGPTAWTGERALNSPHRTKPRIDDQGRFVDYRPAQDRVPIGVQVYHHPHDQHNRVRRERIIDGSDVRTTVMLRNIPNKLDWLSLKTILDDVCFGTFDFVYLRIDFKTGCNVGYAFINFADVHGMIALLDRIERRCWVGFRSGKAAEISYATIQGREALVQKFRNSSVMQETPFCRPRLFFTYTDAELMGQLRSTGTEQSFPRPDNLSKLQRSIDSARSVGLYPPHGQFFNITEHRNRSSTYDRGTPRDVGQAAFTYARQRAAAPIPFMDLSDLKKRDIEVWYSCNYGSGNLGHILPFDCIPMTHVALYFAEMFAPRPHVPGVIGTAINGPFGNHNFASAAAMTPTRRRYGSPRAMHTPMYANQGTNHGAGNNINNSPFA